LDEKEERQWQDNAAIATARLKTEKNWIKVKQEQKQQLDKQVQKAGQSPGFFSMQKRAQAPSLEHEDKSFIYLFIIKY